MLGFTAFTLAYTYCYGEGDYYCYLTNLKDAAAHNHCRLLVDFLGAAHGLHLQAQGGKLFFLTINEKPKSSGLGTEGRPIATVESAPRCVHSVSSRVACPAKRRVNP